MSDRSVLKKRAIAAIDAARDELVQLSLAIHANPEVAFQEFKSSALVCDALEKHGMQVTRGIAGLDTAFRAERRGRGDGPTIALLAEYDALPEIGHACGHNIMATACVGAAVAINTLMAEMPGTFLVIGTPAEEGGAGKVILLERGALAGLDAAMLVHPAERTMVNRGSLASNRLKIEFAGKAAHAASSPQDGVNALEAVIQTFNNINALRLHLLPDARVHGIILDGGKAVNVIPEQASALFSIRALSQTYANQVLARVIKCAQAAELSTGARLKATTIPGYANMIPNRSLARTFAANWREIGIEVLEPRPNEPMGSTDMGDVSQVIPALHPYIRIVSEEIAGHTVEFREAAISPAGHLGMLNAAKGMAMTAIDLLTDPELMQQVQSDFAADHPAH